MEDVYVARYKTGKKGIAICGIVIIALILIIVVCIITGASGLTPYPVIALFFSVGAAFISLKSYREIVLYKTRMEVIGVIDGVISDIDYKDIERVGFSPGHTDYNYSSRRFGNYVESVPVSELIILLKGGGRLMFGDDDYDNLHEVCAYIQERIGQYE